MASTLYFLTLLPFFIATAAADSCTAPRSSYVSIIPMYGKCSPFSPPLPSAWPTAVMDMANRDPQRVAYLASLVAGRKPAAIPVASGFQTLNLGNYIVRVRIGTPGQPMLMVLDTSRDGAWVPCAGCTGCAASTFLFNTSTTFNSITCSAAECSDISGQSCPAAGSPTCFFNQSYGGDSSLAASLSRDTLTLGNDVIPSYAFGCVNAVSGKSVPPQGLLGLGRGSLSLLAQTGSRYSGVFSYCLPSFKSYYFSGSLKLGPIGQPTRIRTTPLLKNPHRPSLYYLNLTGISIGRVWVSTDPKSLQFDPNLGSGTIIDSGTVITRFVEPVYAAVRDEFRKQVKGPFSTLGAFDTCFVATNDGVVPSVTLHFEGLDLKLPIENSLIHSSSGSLACLAMAAAPSNVNSGLNVIANLQQQNLRIVFDVAKSRLGIVRELCN